jgi:preprotein translocase subunit SecF
LGVGTLMDLALVQLVGVIVGTYSSIYFATPLLVTLRERTTLVRTHTRRVLNRRKGSAAKTLDTDADESPPGTATAAAVASTASAPEKPSPGARPVRPTNSRTGRPSGKRNTRRR